MEIAKHWRLKKERYGLIGETCVRGHKIFPTRDQCVVCDGDDPDRSLRLFVLANYQQKRLFQERIDQLADERMGM